VSTLDTSRTRSLIVLQASILTVGGGASLQFPRIPLISHHTDITLQVVPKLKYTLSLLVDDEERELQRIDDRTWEPAKPLYAPCFFDTCTRSSPCIYRNISPTSQMHVEIQVKKAHLSLGRKEQGTTKIDCQALFNDYWSTTDHEFLVQGQLESPTSPFIADREGTADIVAGKHSCSLELQFSVEVTVRPLIIVHRKLLILFA